MRKTDLVSLTALVLALLMVLLLFITGFAQAKADARRNLYAKVAVVSSIDEAQDIVVCEDTAGLLWAFRGIEDWQVGDCIGLLMDSQGTETVFDDTIVSARYSAWSVR